MWCRRGSVKYLGGLGCSGLSIVLSCILTGCGGGGNRGGAQNPQPSYILTINPTTLSVYPGGTATVTVTGQLSR
jgi:hypothetical protein